LQACVTSVLSQTFSSFEVVVSDNASDDNTAVVLQSFSDDRLRIIRQPRNIGPTANWNACLDAARGIYVVMLSDDDELKPTLLEHCGNVISVDASIPIVVAMGDVSEPQNGTRQPARLSRILTSGVCEGTDILLEFLKCRISPQMCTIAIRVNALRANGGFAADWPHTGDLAAWLPMLFQGRAGFVNESCGAYRSHDHTQTHRLPFETRFKDIERLATVISTAAERAVLDPVVLRELKKAARRYVALNCIGHLAAERRKGASRLEIIRLAWSRRHRLLDVNPADLLSQARPIAIFVLPLPVVRLVRRLKRQLRRLTHRDSDMVPPLIATGRPSRECTAQATDVNV
jgi:glycosyltransferase involved in cell wall biosynthesis